VKKGVIVVLVLLAVLILVSPAIVGRLAEKSMDENLNWAASESGELKVSSEQFERGWFSSEGRHRIEISDGQLMNALRTAGGDDAAADLPALVVSTRIDHGLIPVTSVGRDGGSLAPGLGSAISTMQLEIPGEDPVDIPGTIYSKIGLGGALQSSYVLEAGSHSQDGMEATWSDTNIDVTTDPGSGKIEFEGEIGTLEITADGNTSSLQSASFSGTQSPTRFDGVAVGEIELELDDLALAGGPGQSIRVSKVLMSGSSELDGDDIAGEGNVSLSMDEVPGVGSLAYEMEVSMAGLDAATVSSITAKLEDAAGGSDPMGMYATVEDDLMALFADGFEFNFDKLNVTLPQGTIESQMAFSFREEDPDTFAWTSLLTNTEARIDVSIPAELMDAFATGNEQLQVAIAAGYLVREGDAYAMKAELKKGLLTINGAPIPIPAMF
jgi:uncharacterized protein YdgA (DUF945 family)